MLSRVIFTSATKRAYLISFRRYTASSLTSTLEINKIPEENVVNHVFKNYKQWIDAPALTCATSGRSYDYGTLRSLITKCAQAYLGRCGMKPKETIGLLLPNIPEFSIVCHGAIQAGLIVTFANPLYKSEEIKRQFENGNVTLIVTIPQLLQVAMAVASKLDNYKGTINIGGEDEATKKIFGLQSLLLQSTEIDLPEINFKDLAILPYSSGTTGLPKGVMLSHFNLVANLIQGEHPLIEDPYSKSGKIHTFFNALPFFHIYGFNGVLNVCLKKGGHIVTLPRFTPEDYIQALIKYQPTFLFVVPSLLLFLASHPAVRKEHLKAVECIQSGAAPLTEGLLQKFQEKAERDDIRIRQGYGMTESSPVTFCMPKGTPKSKSGTIGIALPGTESKIVSLNDGKTLGVKETGELLVRGPQIMMGYLNNPKATAETLDQDGWLRTGDVAYYDEDRYFFIVDRCKELIKVKGNQVSPTELENLIFEISGVADVAVVGIPDERSGEVPKAFVVLRSDSEITENDIISHLNPKIANYKKLTGGVKFISSIPRNQSGKILRNELKHIP